MKHWRRLRTGLGIALLLLPCAPRGGREPAGAQVPDDFESVEIVPIERADTHRVFLVKSDVLEPIRVHVFTHDEPGVVTNPEFKRFGEWYENEHFNRTGTDLKLYGSTQSIDRQGTSLIGVEVNGEIISTEAWAIPPPGLHLPEVERFGWDHGMIIREEEQWIFNGFSGQNLKDHYRIEKVLAGAPAEMKKLRNNKKLRNGREIPDIAFPVSFFLGEYTGASFRPMGKALWNGQWREVYPSVYGTETDSDRVAEDFVNHWHWKYVATEKNNTNGVSQAHILTQHRLRHIQGQIRAMGHRLNAATNGKGVEIFELDPSSGKVIRNLGRLAPQFSAGLPAEPIAFELEKRRISMDVYRRMAEAQMKEYNVPTGPKGRYLRFKP